MNTHISGIDKLAERNMRKWALAEHVEKRLEKRDVEENVGPYVTISRELGTHGSEIARLLAEKLGWDLLDREIIDYMVEHYGTPRDVVEFVDKERASWIADVFRTWIEGQRLTDAAYAHRLIELFLLAAQHGKVVIVGRGAQFVLPKDKGLSVRLMAPFDFRANQIAEERGLNQREARKVVEESDRQRREFIKKHFHHEVTDACEYDLVIDVENLKPDDVAQRIVNELTVGPKKLID